MPISWEGVYKEVFVTRFKLLGISLATEYEVGRLARRIDAVAVCGPKERKKLARSTPFDFFRTHNLMEVKSLRDPLNLAEFHRILARGHLYFADKELADEDEMLICIITASLPRKLLSLRPEKGGLSQAGPGLYENVRDLKCYVIVASELAVEKRNYPLLLLAKGRKRREYIRALIANREVEYIRYAYLLYPSEVQEELRMSKTKESYDIEANLRYIVNSVGWEAFVDSVGLDEMVKGVGLSEIVKGVGTKNVTKAVVESAGPHEAENMMRALVESVGPGEAENMMRALVESAGPHEAENMMRALVEQFGPQKAAEMLERVKSDGNSRRRKKRKKSK